MNDTFTEIYVKKYLEWQAAGQRMEEAANIEKIARRDVNKAWEDVKRHMSPGAYSVRDRVLIVGEVNCPEPMRLYTERAMHECRKCAVAQGQCRCMPISGVDRGWA